MKTIVSGMLLLLVMASFFKEDEWTNLLDKNLSQWEMYLSYRHKVGYKGDIPKDEKGNIIKPIGYNNNVNNVFSVIEENGEPVLKVSGEIYGCVFTKQEFENYHFKVQVKWGDKKWEPRMDEDMDSGILYHSVGECGVDYWRAWMLSQEFQIIKKGFGDYWSIANSRIDIKAAKPDGKSDYFFNKDAATVSFGGGTGIMGYCRGSEDVEKPHGEWNVVELICFQDKSVYIVNGHVVMALSNSSYFDGKVSKPLTKGKIQLQSEAAEVYYKDIKIKKIKALPAEYTAYF